MLIKRGHSIQKNVIVPFTLKTNKTGNGNSIHQIEQTKLKKNFLTKKFFKNASLCESLRGVKINMDQNSGL